METLVTTDIVGKEVRIGDTVLVAHTDSNNLFYTKVIDIRPKRMKETFAGYPGFLKNEDEWKAILEKMCKAFRLYINCDNDCIEDLRTIKMLHGDDKPDELEKILKDHEDYEEGMALFFQYWNWLGD